MEGFTGVVQVGWLDVGEPSLYEDQTLGLVCLQPGHHPIEMEFANGKGVEGTVCFTIRAMSSEGAASGRVHEIQHACSDNNLHEIIASYGSAEISFLPFVSYNKKSIDINPEFEPKIIKNSFGFRSTESPYRSRSSISLTV